MCEYMGIRQDGTGRGSRVVHARKNQLILTNGLPLSGHGGGVGAGVSGAGACK